MAVSLPPASQVPVQPDHAYGKGDNENKKLQKMIYRWQVARKPSRESYIRVFHETGNRRAPTFNIPFTGSGLPPD